MSCREQLSGRPRRRPWRRWCALVLAAVALGAVTNVLVAWGILVSLKRSAGSASANYGIGVPAIAVDEATVVHEHYLVRVWRIAPSRVFVWEVEGFEQTEWTGAWARERGAKMGGLGAIDLGDYPSSPKALEYALQLAKQPLPSWLMRHQPGRRHLVATTWATGWPTDSMACRTVALKLPWDSANSHQELANQCVEVPNWSWLPRDWRGSALPIIPLWPGFLINLCVYVLAWLSVFWLVGSTRRLWRRVRYRRRGRCEKCGYDLRGLSSVGQLGEGVCPECGEPRRADV